MLRERETRLCRKQTPIQTDSPPTGGAMPPALLGGELTYSQCALATEGTSMLVAESPADGGRPCRGRLASLASVVPRAAAV